MGDPATASSPFVQRLRDFITVAPPAGLFTRGKPLSYTLLHIHFLFDPFSASFQLQFARVVSMKAIIAWYVADRGSSIPWADHDRVIKDNINAPPQFSQTGVQHPRVVWFMSCTIQPKQGRTGDTSVAHVGSCQMVNFSFSGFAHPAAELDWSVALKLHTNAGFDPSEPLDAVAFYTAAHFASDPAWMAKATTFWNQHLSQWNKDDLTRIANESFPKGKAWDMKAVAYAWTKGFHNISFQSVTDGWLGQYALSTAAGKIKRYDIGGGTTICTPESGGTYTERCMPDGSLMTMDHGDASGGGGSMTFTGAGFSRNQFRYA
ncbi:hypothetical protein RQP46_003295 [Phenoliferia psychrophenolica]